MFEVNFCNLFACWAETLVNDHWGSQGSILKCQTADSIWVNKLWVHDDKTEVMLTVLKNSISLPLLELTNNSDTHIKLSHSEIWVFLLAPPYKNTFSIFAEKFPRSEINQHYPVFHKWCHNNTCMFITALSIKYVSTVIWFSLNAIACKKKKNCKRFQQWLDNFQFSKNQLLL